MRNVVRVLSALIVCVIGIGANAADSKAVQTMAGILTKLQHFPNAEDKQALTQIADDKNATANERTLAKALLNVQHKVAAGDKVSLEAIANDAKATNGEKTLAGVVLSLNHYPSAADKEKLAALK